MNDTERLRKAIEGAWSFDADTMVMQIRTQDIAAAIVEEFELVRDEYGVDMNREGLERFVYALLDVAEGK
jgi:hypothetical protein